MGIQPHIFKAIFSLLRFFRHRRSNQGYIGHNRAHSGTAPTTSRSEGTVPRRDAEGAEINLMALFILGVLCAPRALCAKKSSFYIVGGGLKEDGDAFVTASP